MPRILKVTIVWKDPKAVKAVRVIARALDSAGDAMQWNPELKRAAKAARYLLRNMEVVSG